ncbi:kexin [Starmerella bacillaris]|uniref:Kexin n=1 Tax=Starmerella bacillaris TaxID=1247836 RepID=A0AAV5RL46_STABA|nr:kexin [Starmerella bacillaris]
MVSTNINTLVLALACYAASVRAGELWQRKFAEQPNPGTRDLETRDYYVVVADDPYPSASAFNLTVEEPFPITDHWLVSVPRGAEHSLTKRGLDVPVYSGGLSRLKRRAPVPHADSQSGSQSGSQSDSDSQSSSQSGSNLKPLYSTDIHDPLFKDQWFIKNEDGNDINVLPVWAQGITGTNVTVAIVDDGIDYDHPDFSDSFSLEGSWDYNLHQQNPKPLLNIDTHGTRCAGEVAAGLNNACGVGVAPGAKVAGIRILSGALTVADEARALIHQNQLNDIYSCSWGPSDDGKTIDGPPPLVRRAELEGIENGRQGRGSIYVVASGNGYAHGDGCNYDGYTNSIYSITIGAVDKHKLHPYYAEVCSANMAVTYSSNYVDKITTSDRLDPLDPDTPKCTDQHSGTSAAAPIAAGLFALVLQKRPELTWRDLQYVVREAAQPFDIAESSDGSGSGSNKHKPSDLNAHMHANSAFYNDWQLTFDNKKYHNAYGYGLLDAEKLVAVAADFELVNPQTWFFSPVHILNYDFEESVSHTIRVSQSDWKNSNLRNIEHVRVRLSYQREFRGMMMFKLQSPNGIVSELAAPRQNDGSGEAVIDWEFMSVVHWGEQGAGDWKLIIESAGGLTGTLHSWQLKLFGQAEDASKVKRYSEVWDQYESHEDVVQPAVPPPTENHDEDNSNNENGNNENENNDNGNNDNSNSDNGNNDNGNNESENNDNGNNENENNDNGNNDNNSDNNNNGENDHEDTDTRIHMQPMPTGMNGMMGSETMGSSEMEEMMQTTTMSMMMTTPTSMPGPVDNNTSGNSNENQNQNQNENENENENKKPSPHSLSYYIFASMFGMLLLSSIGGPVVYWYVKRRAQSKRYVQLDDEFSGDFELDDYDEFEVDASDIDFEGQDDLDDLHHSDNSRAPAQSRAGPSSSSSQQVNGIQHSGDNLDDNDNDNDNEKTGLISEPRDGH